MLSILSAIIGFIAPFAPEVLKLFQRKQDNLHELAMMEMQIKAASQQQLYKLEQLNAQADIAESIEIHKPTQSFGVQLLDASSKWADTKWGRYMISPVFFLFALLDFISGAVRPFITFGIVALYAAVKAAQVQVSLEYATLNHALASIWTEQDFAILTLTLSYWFGSRAYKSAFGGSASDNKKN